MAEEGGAAGPSEPMPTEEELLRDGNLDTAFRDFLNEMKSVDRDNEVERILRAFKLNPYEQLGVRFDASEDDIKRAYRKTSLMVHPDKCKHPHAKEAFEVLGRAHKLLTGGPRSPRSRGFRLARHAYDAAISFLYAGAENPELMEDIKQVVEYAREELRKDVRKEQRRDVTAKLAALIHEEGQEGVLSEYELSEEFHDRWRAKAREMLAQAEWRRRKIHQRSAEENKRLEKQLNEMHEKEVKAKEHGRKWEKARDQVRPRQLAGHIAPRRACAPGAAMGADLPRACRDVLCRPWPQRVGAWRDFMKTKGAKVVKSTGMPKNRAEDPDRLYVRRVAQGADHFKD